MSDTCNAATLLSNIHSCKRAEMRGAASTVTHQIRWHFRHRMAEKCRREKAFR